MSDPVVTRNTGTVGMLIAVSLGAMVAVALGVFGKIHEPQFFSINVAGFSSGTAVKSWLATLAIVLALFQLSSAFVMYRLTPGGRAPTWIGTAHIWSGRLAVLATVPVAVHCLYALGFAETDSRVLFHSLFGCFFYGVFVTKMILLTRGGLHGWVLPVVGGLVFFGLVYVWLTSALWFFQTSGLRF
ncbi:DUF6529 family protein [Mycobacterium sp. 852014-52144_SCH5372336]|uniref:DUF6529 family protein n=1 Tax=Mycobacterium sp. 852014-52144_SCH5372336 TaxID=1834115 RepID=UPI0008012A52|nr:DUF6529 family protein [Mycobacterium sp. 852014-52144_SCH5372336]OBB74693.1 hypothetical protein A5759_10430 [Mycobacterium sp. 852014-52144_SCH5372336]